MKEKMNISEQLEQEDAEQLVYLVMGRDEYGQYESRKGSWDVLEVCLDPDVANARVEQLKKKDPFSGYQMWPKRVSS